MVEFTPAILAHLILAGFKELVVENSSGYALIEPVKDLDVPIASNAYTIPIYNEQAAEMTKRILLLDMKFYIDSKYNVLP